MMSKALITLVLVLGVFQAQGLELSGESVHLAETAKTDIEQMKNVDDKGEWSVNRDHKLRDKKDHHEHHSDEFIKANEIERSKFVEKYNKYGKTFNPNLVDKTYKKHKESYNNWEKHNEHGYEKPKTLIHDIDINYAKGNKKINKFSETVTGSDLHKTKENYQENYQNKNEFYAKRSKKNFYKNLKNIDLSVPPKNNTVLMARYIVHTVDWTALGTVSVRNPTTGSPFVCAKAVSDGPLNMSTGVPFFYLSSLDLCTQDSQKNNRVSMLLTLSQTEYCKDNNLDPQDPRCAKLTLSGEMKRIKAGSEEESFAKKALFSRHPVMEKWPTDHNFYFAKLKIGQIVLLDRFGGATYIDVKDYLNAGSNAPEK